MRDAEDAHYESARTDQLTHPGVALVVLEEADRALLYRVFCTALRPPWYDQLRSSAGGAWFPDSEALELAVKTNADQPALGPWIEHLKGSARRLHQGLRMKIGSTRSLFRLLLRFKTRCEWHDRSRLLALGASDVGEDRLTEELARWLFDQGLNPITQPLMAGLRPDLFDPTKDPTYSLYVEAKQYRSARYARSTIIKGARQLYNTVLRLRGDHYSITEAFYVIFRRGGPDFLLPSTVKNEGWTLFPLVVDIGPGATSGSRQRARPQVITAADLAPSNH
jgi:hypothetical protein